MPPLTGVVLNSESHFVRLLLNGERTQVSKELVKGQINPGQKVFVLYDFTRMTIRSVLPNIDDEGHVPFEEASPEGEEAHLNFLIMLGESPQRPH